MALPRAEPTRVHPARRERRRGLVHGEGAAGGGAPAGGAQGQGEEEEVGGHDVCGVGLGERETCVAGLGWVGGWGALPPALPRQGLLLLHAPKK